MQCVHCKGSISLYNLIREKKCPSCSQTLKRMPTWEQVKESVISFSEDKGYIFWAIVYVVGVWVIAFFEQIFATGLLFDYITDHEFRFLFLAAYSGSIIDYVAKANVEVTAVRNKFIFKPPLYLRAYRRWTNIFLFLGIALTIYALQRWPNYMSFLPALTLLTSITLGLIWAIMGFALTEDDLNDKRIRYFLEEMRVGRVKYYHRASALYIGGLFVAGVIYYKLVHTTGLWFYIWNSRVVYNTVTFFKNYFGWVKEFVD